MPQRRSGSTYLLVLFTSLIVSVIGFAAFSTVRVQDQTAGMERDWNGAAVQAISATEFGLASLGDDYWWREVYRDNTEGNYTATRTLGRGDIAWQLEDPVDGDVGDQAADPVRIYGRGRVGSSQRIFSVLAWPSGNTLDVLRTAVHASGDLTVDGALDVRKGPMSSNRNVWVSGAQVLGDVEAQQVDRPDNIIGSVQTSAPAKTMPSSMLFSVYKAFGTEIPFWSTASGGDGVLQNVLISPRHHPTMPEQTNASGLYWIQMPLFSTLTIRNCRIDGTLLVRLNAFTRLRIGPGVVWRSHRPDFPSLIVYTSTDWSANVDIECSGQLAEALAGTNFNPAQSPYYGRSDDDRTDVYNAAISGLVHIIRDTASPSSVTTIAAPRKISGCILADGVVRISGDSILAADPQLYAKPPLGYTTYPQPNNLLVNGGIEQGLTGWTAVGAGTKLQDVGGAHGGSRCLKVKDRSTAAAGVEQDVTGRISNGVPLTSDVWVKLDDAVEDVSVTLLISSTAEGTQRFTATAAAGTGWTRVRVQLTPAWSGTLNWARWRVATTTTRQEFRIDDASIADPDEQLPLNLTAVPGTWRSEPIPQ